MVVWNLINEDHGFVAKDRKFRGFAGRFGQIGEQAPALFGGVVLWGLGEGAKFGPQPDTGPGHICDDESFGLKGADDSLHS